MKKRRKKEKQKKEKERKQLHNTISKRDNTTVKLEKESEMY